MRVKNRKEPEVCHRLIRLVVGCAVAVSLLAATVSPAATIVKPFQKGDRVAFVGDSITHWGAYAYIVSAFYQTRFPERKIYWGYFGRGGSTAAFWLQEADPKDPHPEWPNLQKLLAFRPTVATIMLGMNDSAYGDVWLLPDDRKSQMLAHLKAKYEESMDSLIARLRAAGVKRIILIIPSPYDEVQITDPKWKPLVGKNALMKDVFGGYLVRKSKELGEPVIDFMTPMLRINQIEQKTDPKFSVVDLGDRIHPGKVGHFVMGYTFLKAQGLEGKVSETVISASRAEVVTQTNCEITGLRVSEDGVTWTCRSGSLPFPPRVPSYVDYEAMKGAGWAKYVPFDEEFNQEIVRVTGLPSGKYALKIDDIEIGKYPSDEIERGINIANNKTTPQSRQADSVNSFRAKEAGYAPDSAFGYWYYKWNDDSRVDLTYRALQPVPRKYTLAKVE